MAEAERTCCPCCGGKLQSFERIEDEYWCRCIAPWVDWLGGRLEYRSCERYIDICEDCETVVS